ncbi:MAG: hypothetical protein NT007_00580 [Candidatus Kapabacteria bacterium]|nr:hypothetical protein [Candidatus Kapabacteria bacterium]
MKFTKYFEYTRLRADRIGIKEDWIANAFFNPIHEETQIDGRIRRWAKIDDADGKYLRIVILDDNETIHNAFFDRSFKEKL